VILRQLRRPALVQAGVTVLVVSAAVATAMLRSPSTDRTCSRQPLTVYMLGSEKGQYPGFRYPGSYDGTLFLPVTPRSRAVVTAIRCWVAGQQRRRRAAQVSWLGFDDSATDVRAYVQLANGRRVVLHLRRVHARWKVTPTPARRVMHWEWGPGVLAAWY
jgi:hypothetical protein